MIRAVAVARMRDREKRAGEKNETENGQNGERTRTRRELESVCTVPVSVTRPEQNCREFSASTALCLLACIALREFGGERERPKND